MSTQMVERTDDRGQGLTVPLVPRPRRLGYTWAPRLDIFETPRGLMVEVELPGVRHEDIAIWLDGDELVISGQRRVADGPADDAYCRRERERGRFHRRVPLPIRPAAEEAIARLADGVLSVELPRLASVPQRPHRISISPSREDELAERQREQVAQLDDEAWNPALD